MPWRTLKAHGLAGRALWDVAGATTISRQYNVCLPGFVWLHDQEFGEQGSGDHHPPQTWWLPAPDQEDFSEICENADHKVVQKCAIKIMFSISYCLLWNLLLITCAREFIIVHYHPPPPPDNSFRKNFIYRQLYKDTSPILDTFIVLAAIFCCLLICVFLVFSVYIRLSCVNKVSTYLLNYLLKNFTWRVLLLLLLLQIMLSNRSPRAQ